MVVATGQVTTVAGTAGMSGSTDASGTAARFNSPFAEALDGAGNLYVSDTSNNTIRKIVLATGAVTTIAGTAGMSGSVDASGTAARFNGPSGLGLDSAGNLYVTEYISNTIRKIVLATGAVTTIAGTAGMSGSTDGIGKAARFNSPNYVKADNAGNLYISDTGNNTIREVARCYSRRREGYAGGLRTCYGWLDLGAGLLAQLSVGVVRNIVVDRILTEFHSMSA